MDSNKERDNPLYRIIHSIPRNKFEQEENRYISELYKYVFKDLRSFKAFTDLVFFYRKEFSKMYMALNEKYDDN